jgi:DNA-binding beta-propeller fold protein YncE
MVNASGCRVQPWIGQAVWLVSWVVVASCRFELPRSSGDGAISDGGPLPLDLEVLAGDIGGRGNLDGAGAAAHFSFPSGAAVDSAGNVYVADTDNSTIRKVSAAGTTTTIAGMARMTGIALGATPLFAFPERLVTSGDSIVISDSNAILVLRHGAQ